MPNKIIEGQSPYREKLNIGTLPTLAGIGFLVSACATPANGEGEPIIHPTQSVPTEVSPTEVIPPTPEPAGYGESPEATPAPTDTAEVPGSIERFAPPTAEDALIKSEVEAIPEFAQVKYDLMKERIPEIAESCGVSPGDVSIRFVSSGVGNEYRWTLVAETPYGICWSGVLNEEGEIVLAEYPSYWNPGTDQIMGVEQGVSWTLVTGEFAWLGTVPGMLSGLGHVPGDAENFYRTRYIVPDGLTKAEIKNQDLWSGIEGVEEISSTEWWAALESDVEHQLTPEDLEILELEGKGFAVKTEYEGVQVSISVLSSTDVLANTGGKGPTLNENLPSGAEQPSINRLAQVVLMGHWRGYSEDHGELPFTTYLARMRAGEDMSYVIKGYAYGSSEATEITVDPTKPVELVAESQLNGVNGRSPIKHTVNFGYGYSLSEDGSLRAIIRIPALGGAEIVYYDFSVKIAGSLWLLGLSPREQNPGYNLEQLDYNLDDDSDFILMFNVVTSVDPGKGYADVGDTIVIPQN